MSQQEVNEKNGRYCSEEEIDGSVRSETAELICSGTTSAAYVKNQPDTDGSLVEIPGQSHSTYGVDPSSPERKYEPYGWLRAYLQIIGVAFDFTRKKTFRMSPQVSTSM